MHERGLYDVPSPRGGEEMTQWLVADTTNVKGGKIEHSITERPLLHACCNQDHFGDVNLDIDPAMGNERNPKFVLGDVCDMPFDDNTFEAAFADFPWVGSWRFQSAQAIKEMLRVAPVAYTISPWLYGSKNCYPETIHVSWRPGINHPILFVRYVRR